MTDKKPKLYTPLLKDIHTGEFHAITWNGMPLEFPSHDKAQSFGMSALGEEALEAAEVRVDAAEFDPQPIDD